MNPLSKIICDLDLVRYISMLNDQAWEACDASGCLAVEQFEAHAITEVFYVAQLRMVMGDKF